MTIYVLVYKIITTYSGSYAGSGGGSPYTLTADNFLHVKLDDVANTLSLEYSSSSTPGAGTIYSAALSEGPGNLYFGYGGFAELLTASPFYQYCEGTTLHKVGTSNGFPYGTLSTNLNNSECQIAPVCDIELGSDYTVTPASGPATADGAITLTATSSNGVIKYSMDPGFIYATEGQTSPTFSGLYADNYTVYAKDEAGCLDSIQFTIPVTEVYGVRHRLDFYDDPDTGFAKKFHRVDIEERSYAGAFSDMCAAYKQPVMVRYEGDTDNPNKPLIASHLTLKIMVEAEGQYTHLSDGNDDRKYRIKYYNGDDVGSLSLYHVGFVVPEFHSEPYLFAPYEMQVVSSDQIGEFKNQDFYDIDGNKYRGDLKSIKIIAGIFKLTGLNLNIRCGVNVFDSGMNTAATDDPFDQAYVDTRIFYTEKGVADKCDRVLSEFALPFRAQIFQSMGVWWIIRVSDAVGTFAYREFDSNGDYVSNSTIDPVIQLGFPQTPGVQAMFAEKSQILSYLRNYGYFSITHDLKKDGNLIDTGRFEAEDLIELGSGNLMFKQWNFTLGQGGTAFGLEVVVNGDSRGAFYADYTAVNSNQADAVLYSDVIPMDSSQGALRLKFQHFVSPKFTFPYIRVAWALKCHLLNGGPTDFAWLTYGPNGAITFALTEVKNDLYISAYDQFNTFDILTSVFNSTPIDSFQIFIYFHDHHGRDFVDETALRAFDLSALPNPIGIKRLMQGASGQQTLIYTSEASTDADSSPNVIRPDNYAGDYLWRLSDTINFLGMIVNWDGLVNRFKFDNVSMAFYPGIPPNSEKIDPPEQLVYSEEVSTFVKSNYELPVLLGDMIRFDPEVGQTRNESGLYRSYFRLADGTPTLNWNRTGVSEAKRILQIHLEDLIAQFSEPQRRLSGIKVTNTIVHFVNCLRDNIDGTRYRPLTFDFDVKNAMYTPNMCGVLAGADGEPPLTLGEFDNEQFSNAFNTGS